MSAPLRSPESDASAVVDPFLLSVLRCPDCLSPVVPSGPALACNCCRRDYPLLDGHIPSLFAATEAPLEVQKTWDGLIKDNYEQVVDATAAILYEIDRVELPYCRGDVLEIGCGSGRFLSLVTGEPGVARAVGLDVSAGMLGAAAARGLGRLVHGSGNRLPFADASFDTAASTFGSLMYVERPLGYREIARMLRDGGVLVFDLLNYWPEYLDTAWTRLRSTGRWPSGLSQEYLLRHKMRSARREVRMLKEAGFSLRVLKSTPYLPLLRRWTKKLRSMNGYFASLLGADTIFVAVKERRPNPAAEALRSAPFYSPPLKA